MARGASSMTDLFERWKAMWARAEANASPEFRTCNRTKALAHYHRRQAEKRSCR